MILLGNKIGIIKFITKSECSNEDNYMCLIDGFYVTAGHPIYNINDKKSDWKLASSIVKPIKITNKYVYDIHFVLEDNTLTDTGFIVKGLSSNWIACPIGHKINHHTTNNDIFKTYIIDILQMPQFETPINNDGIIFINNKHKLLVKECDDETLINRSYKPYGFIYKNKIFTIENRKVKITYNEKIKNKNIINFKEEIYVK